MLQITKLIQINTLLQVSLHIVCWNHETCPSNCETVPNKPPWISKEAASFYSTHNKDYISTFKCSSYNAVGITACSDGKRSWF